MVVCGCCNLKPATQRRALLLMLGAVLLSSLFALLKERRFAREMRKLSPILSELTPASCVPSPQNDGVYVHLECPIRNSSTFYPPENFYKNINPFQGVFFEVKAEMYQYPQLPDLLGRRHPKWVDHLVPGSLWSLVDGLRNPDFFPHVPGIGRQLASGLKAGGFTLPGEFAVFFRKKQQLPLQDDGVYRQQEQRPPRKIDAETTLVHNNFLYTGSPFKPQIGDIRVSFWANASSHISLIGKQTKPFFGSARAIAAAAAAELKEGQPLTIAAEGDYEPQRLIEHRLQDLGFPYSFVWTWRLVLFFSFFLLFVSFDGCGSEEAAAAEPTATTTQTNSKHFPLWTRVIVAALAAAAATFLLLAGAWWGVQPTIARRLAFIAAALAVAALLFRLLLPRLLPASTSPDTTAEGKYYDLGICLQVPGSLRSSTSSISHASSAAEGAAPEYKQGTVIRWTTTPALGPSPQDSLRRGSASAAAVPPTTGNSTTAAGSSEASSLYGAAYKNNGINSQDFGVYVPPPVMQTRAGSLTGVSLQKSSSKGSI